MKKPISLLIFLVLGTIGLEAQSTAQSQVNVPAPTPYTVVTQDANSRAWQRQEYEAGSNGQITTHVCVYNESAKGLRR